MIKAVLFDFGGVLTEGGKVGSIRTMFAHGYGVEPQAVRLDTSVKAAFKGEISDEALVATVNRLNPHYTPLTTDVLIKSADIYDRSEPVYELAKRLRAAGIVTGVFSNVFATSAAILYKTGCYEDFSPLFLSYEQHRLKPDTGFYRHALNELQLAPAEVLFVDDKSDYLTPARKLGMHVVLARNPAQIVHDVTAAIASENNLHL